LPQTEILKNGTRVFADDIHRINADGPLLASFIKLKSGERLLDLCSGSGIVPLWLFDRGFKGRVSAVEIQHEAAELFRKAVTANGIGTLEIFEGALNDYRNAEKFEAVSCNPPYYTDNGGRLADDIGRTAARFASREMISDAAKTAAENLKQGGRFYCCWPPARMESLFAALRSAGLAPKRLRFCRHSQNSSPWLVLMEARLHGGEGLEVMTDFVSERDSQKTSEYLEIFT